MKTILLILALAAVVSFAPPDQLCPRAHFLVVSAQEQEPTGPSPERQVPDGHWCQRAARQMPSNAHACACHQHDCSDPDPSHVSAHTDPKCLDYCTVAKCLCEKQDCP